MHYLYLKTHNVTGLKYLGKTSRDPYSYYGSGHYWKLHLKQHGRNISTEILKESEDLRDVEAWGIYYSNLWDVVKSQDFANLMIENCNLGSYEVSRRVEYREKLSKAAMGNTKGAANKGRKHSVEAKTKIKNARASQIIVHSEETRQKIGNSNRGKPKSEAHCKALSLAHLGNSPGNKGKKMYYRENGTRYYA